jgi:hypothetical protein
MKNLKQACLFLMMLLPVQANAQFGGLMNNLAKELEKASSGVIQKDDKNAPVNPIPDQSQTAPTRPEQTQANPTRPERARSTSQVPPSSPPSSENLDTLISKYCENVKSSKVANKIAELTASSRASFGSRGDNLSFPPRVDKPKLLSDWVSSKFSETLKLQTSFGAGSPDFQKLAAAVNECFGKNSDNPIYLISQETYFNTVTGRHPGSVGSSIAKKGGPVIDRKSSETDWRPRSDREYFLYAFFFAGADEFLSRSFPTLISDFEKQIQYDIANDKAVKAKDEAKAKADNEYKQKLAAEAAFQNSPDGKLIYSYERFQIVNLCYEGRKDFKFVFITDKEFGELKSKMKAIEEKLKGSLKENTNKLWAQAEANNRNFKNTGVDAIEVFKNRGGDRTMCSNSAFEINGVANDLLGKESLKKNF